MKKHTQLSLENRHQIKALLDTNNNQSEIARTIGVHITTVYRELKRNVGNDIYADKAYCPARAQQLTNRRYAGCSSLKKRIPGLRSWSPTCL